MEIGSQDAVITSSFSFVASVSCFLYEGALPILVDIDPKTLNLDPEAVREYLRNQCDRSEDGTVIDRRSGRVVKAIMPVHIFGLPCRMDELMKIAGEYGLLVIEDACEAIGATFDGQRTGTFGNAGVFAFYPNKQMTTGEGGMVTCRRSDLAASMRLLSLHGISKDAWNRYDERGNWFYQVEACGFKYNLSRSN